MYKKFMVLFCCLFTAATFAKGSYKTVGLKHSPQRIVFKDNQQVNVRLSYVDVNKLLVKDDKIARINRPRGFLTVDREAGGAAYIAVETRVPFTAYVTTAHGHTLSLFITPLATVGKTIILAPSSASKQATRWEENTAYQQLLVKLIKGMMNKKAPDGYAHGQVVGARPQDFYGVANITPVALYKGTHIQGVVYILQNKTRKPLTLKPSYFYTSEVRAVALSSQTISPMATGLVYEVMSRG